MVEHNDGQGAAMNGELDDLIGRLVAKVWDQWEAEHLRVCGVWPHDGRCVLPPPKVLEAVQRWQELQRL
jgi:hypothetical protein